MPLCSTLLNRQPLPIETLPETMTPRFAPRILDRGAPLRAHSVPLGDIAASNRAPRVRPLLAGDIRLLMAAVGPLVDSLYDRGAQKLLSRLEDARDGYAVAHVLTEGPNGIPLALAAETTKGPRSRKISTFWVAEHYRGRGYGSFLLETRINDWTRSGVEQAHVTVRETRAEQLERLFLPRGFERRLVAVDRYGSGRDEVVLAWSSAESRTSRVTNTPAVEVLDTPSSVA